MEKTLLQRVVQFLSFILLLFLSISFLSAQDFESTIGKVKWEKGPSTGNLGDIARIRIPSGFLFAGRNDTKLLMEAMKNPPSGIELGFLSPEDLSWFIVFEFLETGYIRDDEKHSLDADTILSTIKKGTERSNEERRKRGWPPLNVIGWEKKPHYDSNSNNLEWAIRAESEGNFVTNYNTRLLGRNGVMRVTLVSDPESLGGIVPKFKSLLANFGYNQGHKYAEYRTGDKVAKYGLTGLIVGGVAAVAVKSGLAKGLWKIIIPALIGIGLLIKKLFRK